MIGQKRNFHLFFEQSGTFKQVLLDLGYSAKDYDILNDFGETDCVIDLFREIDNAYYAKPSIFDSITANETIIAFFPCTRFDCQMTINITGKAYQMKNYSDEDKLKYSLRVHDELSRNYRLICQLCIVCIRKNIPLIIENPYTSPHYLTRYFPLMPKVIDQNRHLHGDYYKKPTQYWFINCDPKNNLVFEPMIYRKRQRVGDTNDPKIRSMISPEYAKWWLQTFVLD